MKKILAAALAILTISAAAWGALPVRQDFSSDVSKTIKRRSLTYTQNGSWDLGWRFTQGTAAKDLSAATAVRFMYAPTGTAWMVTATGSVELATNGQVHVMFLPEQLNTNSNAEGNFEWRMVVESATQTMAFAYGALTLIEDFTVSGATPLATGTSLNWAVYSSYLNTSTDGPYDAGTNMTKRAGANGVIIFDADFGTSTSALSGRIDDVQAGMDSNTVRSTANSVTGGLNTAGLIDADAGIASNVLGVIWNAAGVASNVTGLVNADLGIASNVAAAAANSLGVASNVSGLSDADAGIASNVLTLAGLTITNLANSLGVASNVSGLVDADAGIASNVLGIVWNASGVASNVSGLIDADAGIASNVLAAAANSLGVASNVSGLVDADAGIASNVVRSLSNSTTGALNAAEIVTIKAGYVATTYTGNVEIVGYIDATGYSISSKTVDQWGVSGTISDGSTFTNGLLYSVGENNPTNLLTSLIVADSTVTGSELITNGTFAGNATGWTLGGTAAYQAAGTYADTVKVSAGTAGTLEQAATIGLSTGRTYLVSYKQYSFGDVVTASMVMGGITNSDTFTATETKTIIYPTTITNDPVITVTAGATYDVYIDNISVKQITDGDVWVADDLYVGGNVIADNVADKLTKTAAAATYMVRATYDSATNGIVDTSDALISLTNATILLADTFGTNSPTANYHLSVAADGTNTLWVKDAGSDDSVTNVAFSEGTTNNLALSGRIATATFNTNYITPTVGDTRYVTNATMNETAGTNSVAVSGGLMTINIDTNDIDTDTHSTNFVGVAGGLLSNSAAATSGSNTITLTSASINAIETDGVFTNWAATNSYVKVESDPVHAAWIATSAWVKVESDPVHAAWIATSTWVKVESDPNAILSDGSVGLSGSWNAWTQDISGVSAFTAEIVTASTGDFDKVTADGIEVNGSIISSNAVVALANAVDAGYLAIQGGTASGGGGTIIAYGAEEASFPADVIIYAGNSGAHTGQVSFGIGGPGDMTIEADGNTTFHSNSILDVAEVYFSGGGSVTGTPLYSYTETDPNSWHVNGDNAPTATMNGGGQAFTSMASASIGTNVVNGELYIRATDGSFVEVRMERDIGSANAAIGKLIGTWDGTDVASIVYLTGDDTGNKDDGKIAFYTAVSGGSIAEKMRLGPKGTLSMTGTTGGWVLHNVTTAELGALTAQEGMMVYNTTSNLFVGYNGSEWITIGSQ